MDTALEDEDEDDEGEDACGSSSPTVVFQYLDSRRCCCINGKWKHSSNLQQSMVVVHPRTGRDAGRIEGVVVALILWCVSDTHALTQSLAGCLFQPARTHSLTWAFRGNT